MSNTEQYRATGRRKTASARVFLRPGKGDIVVNKRPLESYFSLATTQSIIKQPLEVTQLLGQFDIYVTVKGGGSSGQAGAVRHGIARTLVAQDESLRPILRQAQLLTRDSRAVERKKVGLHKARKATQYSKR